MPDEKKQVITETLIARKIILKPKGILKGFPPSGGGPELCDTVVTEKAFGQSENAGTSPKASRCDHTHGTPPAPTVKCILEYGSGWTENNGGGDIPDNKTMYLRKDDAVETEDAAQYPMPYAGNLKNMFVKVFDNSLSGTGTVYVKARKAKSNTAVVTTFARGATGVFYDTTHTATFAQGDLLSTSVFSTTVDGGGNIGLNVDYEYDSS